MKCQTPEISWHNRDPVLSIDIQTSTVSGSDPVVAGKNNSPNKENQGQAQGHSGNSKNDDDGNKVEKGDDGKGEKDKDKDREKEKEFWRVATGGADAHILIWHLRISDTGVAKVTCVSDLDRHQKAVNIVRFSPNGELLASGDDESTIILWKPRGDSEKDPVVIGVDEDDPSAAGSEPYREHWTLLRVLRGHLEDVYDISWAPDSSQLVSGSVDNSAIVWDVQRGRSVSVLADYKGFVQGVSWDPWNQYLCTLSTDRQFRLVNLATRKRLQRVTKARIPTPPGHPLEGKPVRLFHDDTLKSFFRRLTFSVDGNLVIAPSGILEPQEPSERLAHATMCFSRVNFKEPIMVLPALDECTIAVRCCPVYYELREDGPRPPCVPLPYRMIFAVASQKSVTIYDTQQLAPLAVVSHIHYTRLTDLAWSSDGKVLVVSSTDGYCSVINFQEGELGKVYRDKPVRIQKTAENPAAAATGESGAQSEEKPSAATSTTATTSASSSSEVLPEPATVKISDFFKKINREKEREREKAKEKEKEKEKEKIVISMEVESVSTTEKTASPKNQATTSASATATASTSASTSTSTSGSASASASTVEGKRAPRRVSLITLSGPKRTKRQ